ncbi:hypothetical protein PIB30_012222 [Stylosanthes scabra]|uniref:Uncharacterized protein n=1 Tax=Stylosanthes scabra TaxID=79078 RepID=A0ABU6V7U7_9FABA|nr:hypothetical protein [Stylosanthes scabra]
MSRKESSVFNPIHLSDQSAYTTSKGSSPKCRGRAQGKLKRTREARRMDKKAKKEPNSALTARLYPPYLIWKFPLVVRPRDPDDAPMPPHFVTPKTRTSRARQMGVARPRDDGGTHLKEGYFGDFTFLGHGPSISQAQFDLYGGGTAEAQHTFSHFINFSLSLVLGDFWRSSPSLSFSL